MTLKEKFRQELTGHLSDEKTEVDVNIAVRITEEFAIGFAEWCCDNEIAFIDNAILNLYKKKRTMTPLQRINRVIEFYYKRGQNREKVNEIKRKILKEKFNKTPLN